MNVQCPHCSRWVLRTTVICYSCQGPVAEYYEYYEVYNRPPPRNYSYRQIPYNRPYYSNNPGYRQPVYATRRSNNGCAVLFVLAIIVVAFFATNQHSGYSNSSSSTDSQSVSASGDQSSSSSDSSTDEARKTLQAYYDDVNARDYQAAYNLWYVGNQRAQTYTEFAAGYTQTQHVDLTIQDSRVLSDGTVQLNVTLASQSTTGSRTYRGYYIVGQHDGEWKLIHGQLS